MKTKKTTTKRTETKTPAVESRPVATIRELRENALRAALSRLEREVSSCNPQAHLIHALTTAVVVSGEK